MKIKIKTLSNLILVVEKLKRSNSHYDLIQGSGDGSNDYYDEELCKNICG